MHILDKYNLSNFDKAGEKKAMVYKLPNVVATHPYVATEHLKYD